MYVLNVDWLQVFCRGDIKFPDYCKVEKLDHGTRVFETMQIVSIDMLEYCIILSDPFSKIIKPDTVIIKLANVQLYRPNFIETFAKFIDDAGLEFINYTRIDIAADFNYFDNNLEPSNLIRGLLSNKYLKTKKSGYVIRGNQGAQHSFTGIRIGSAASKLSAYMYDKTKEMNDKVFKNYIYECWQANGLDVRKPVYRLEVSIKHFRILHIDENGNHKDKINLTDLSNSKYVETIYHQCIKTAFRFKINDGNINKSRMNDLKLFKRGANAPQIRFDTDTKDSTRHTKGVINFLENINKEMRANEQIHRTKYSTTAESIAEITGLAKWYDERYKHND